jgi:hypothetical protein
MRRVTVFVSCAFLVYFIHNYMNIYIFMYISKLLFMEFYLNARPVSPGTVLQIMPI